MISHVAPSLLKCTPHSLATGRCPRETESLGDAVSLGGLTPRHVSLMTLKLATISSLGSGAGLRVPFCFIPSPSVLHLLHITQAEAHISTTLIQMKGIKRSSLLALTQATLRHGRCLIYRREIPTWWSVLTVTETTVDKKRKQREKLI